MKRCTVILISLLSISFASDVTAAPPAHRRLIGGQSSDPNPNPGGSAGGTSGSINPPHGPPSGAGAAQPIVGMIGAGEESKKRFERLMDDFLDNPNYKGEPQKAWEQMIGGSGIPEDFRPLLTWEPNDNEQSMEEKLNTLLNAMYQQKADDYLKQLKKYLEENKQYITGHFTTNQGSNYYIIMTSDGPRIIRIREDGTTSMSSVYIFLPPDQYAAYVKAYKEWQRGGARGNFVIPVAGSLAPRPGDTLIEWTLGPTPDKPAPVVLDPGANPGYVTITVPNDPKLIGDLKQHYSHPIGAVLK